jgi:Flavodoxin
VPFGAAGERLVDRGRGVGASPSGPDAEWTTPEREVVGVRVVVVYESVLGPTRSIAESVADGIRAAAPEADVSCVPAARLVAEPLDADLVVVGGPTHYFGLPAERTRWRWVGDVLRRRRAEGGPAQLEPGAAGPGLREWFDELAAPVRRRPEGARTGLTRRPSAAAFDTHRDWHLPSGAAPRIARLLRRHGYRVIARPEGFVVEDVAGPLRAGECERAVAWGAQLAARAGLVPR